MERPAIGTEMTADQIRERLTQVRRAIIAITDNLDRIPKEFQGSTQIDEDAQELALAGQVFGKTEMDLEALRREQEELEGRLRKMGEKD